MCVLVSICERISPYKYLTVGKAVKTNRQRGIDLDRRCVIVHARMLVSLYKSVGVSCCASICFGVSSLARVSALCFLSCSSYMNCHAILKRTQSHLGLTTSMPVQHIKDKIRHGVL